MSAIAYPYLRIDAAEVMANPWSVDEGGWRLLGEYLPDWDYASEVRVRRSVKINVASIADRLGIAASELRLKIVVTVGTGGAREDRLRRIFWASDVTFSQTEFDIELLLDGLEIAQRFTLRTDIVLAGPASAGNILAPKRVGLKLWDDELKVRIEPEEARFPIEALRFSDIFPDSRNALWMLEWTPAALDEDFEGSFRLFVNDDFPDFISRVSHGDVTTLRLLMDGVRLQIVRGALANDEFSTTGIDPEAVTVAAAVTRWLLLAFPAEDIAAVRQLATFAPGRFEAAISGAREETGFHA